VPEAIEIRPDAHALNAQRICRRLSREGLIEPFERSTRAKYAFEQFCEAVADELFQIERERQAGIETRAWDTTGEPEA
jgi:hypothetical protein